MRTSSREAPVGVLYIANAAKIGGGNRVLMDMAMGLDRSRFAPRVITPGPGPLVDWLTAHGIPFAVVGRTGWAGRVDTWLGAASLVLRRSGEAAIVHALSPECYRAASLAGALAGARRVCHIEYPPADGELEYSFRSGPEAVVTCFAAQAEQLSARIRSLSPDCRVLGIPNSIDLGRFKPGSDAPESRESRRFGARHVVVIVGHLSRIKGYPAFLRAASRVARDLDGCAFVAVGDETTDKGCRADLERLVRELGIRSSVHFLGWRNDVPEVLRAADVMALPSLDEGLPLAVLEAMACARPVVATPVGGVPEAVVDGETGILVPPDDPEALAAALLRLLRDPELGRRMGEAGRRRVEAHFSLDRFVERVQALYDELLDGPAAARS